MELVTFDKDNDGNLGSHKKTKDDIAFIPTPPRLQDIRACEVWGPCVTKGRLHQTGQ